MVDLLSEQDIGNIMKILCAEPAANNSELRVQFLHQIYSHQNMLIRNFNNAPVPSHPFRAATREFSASCGKLANRNTRQLHTRTL
jgi:hypothetical protein